MYRLCMLVGVCIQLLQKHFLAVDNCDLCIALMLCVVGASLWVFEYFASFVASFVTTFLGKGSTEGWLGYMAETGDPDFTCESDGSHTSWGSALSGKYGMFRMLRVFMAGWYPSLPPLIVGVN